MENSPTKKDSNLTESQLARIERNKLKAMLLRQSKLVAAPTRTHPYAKNSNNELNPNFDKDAKIIKVQGKKYIDSGGGFLIEEDVGKSSEKDVKKLESITAPSDEAIAIPVEYQECEDCGAQFIDSFLYDNFKYSVCDKCRQPDEKHALITKTEAKSQYLLKDCDIDKRTPILKFITRKNPHNVYWGDMKLYLLLQIEKRAMEVWGTEEEILKQQEEREDKREMGKIKKFKKQMKALRMDVRSSLYDKTTAASHTHEFGPDTYNEDDDNYTHSCLTCEYSETYEKM